MYRFELLEPPYSFVNYNMVSNDECKSLKITKIGKSAAKLLLTKYNYFDIIIGEGSTTIG